MIKVRNYDTIDDPRLISSWDDLFSLKNYCYQSSYVWCSRWLKNFRKGRRKPFIVTAEENGRIVGIGPFMIEKGRLISELKFIGSGLTDFHEILAVPERSDEVIRVILDWVLSRPYYDLINLEQISDGSPLFHVIRQVRAFKAREMVKCPVVNFNSSSWEEYLHKLSYGLRKQWRRQFRNLNKTGRLQFTRVGEIKDKVGFLDRIFDLHRKRWEQKRGVSKFTRDNVRAFISDLVKVAPEVTLYVLLSDDRLLAYEMGFDQKDVFYSWNTGFDPAFRLYSVGIIIRGLVIKDLIERDCRKLNDMRGNYDWKRRWMTNEETLTNCQFLARTSPLTGYLGERYYLSWKWRLKRVFGGLVSRPIVQKALFKARY